MRAARLQIRVNKPSHDKINKMTCAPSEDSISLCVPTVWSESSLSAWQYLGPLAIHRVHSEDSDQTERMRRLIWVFAGRTCHFVGFVMRQLINMHPSDRPIFAWRRCCSFPTHAAPRKDPDQADLNFRRAHNSFGKFCFVLPQPIWSKRWGKSHCVSSS